MKHFCNCFFAGAVAALGFVLSANVCVAADAEAKVVPLDPKWKLVWSDEFDYTGLPNPEKWGYEVGHVRNNELQYYTKERLENAHVEDGRLIIEARKESYEGSDYTSASVISKGKGEWKYGRVEIRAKLPTGKGIWPALWMIPGDGYKKYGWPRGGEIDIMELVGFDPNRVHSTTHTAATMAKVSTTGNTYSMLLDTPQSDYHVYAVEWYPEQLRYYVDDVAMGAYPKVDDTIDNWPFVEKFYLIMNIAWGGAWGGSKGIDPECLPQRMEIDYVRVYQEK